MAARSKVVDLNEALTWLAEGRSGQWIADEYRRRYGLDTSPSMWSRLRKRNGLEPALVRDTTLIPWEVEPRHRHGHAVAMLRAEARERAGHVLSHRTRKHLSSWKQKLRDADEVVMYDRVQGWRYVPRRHDIDLDLIREPVGNQRSNDQNAISTSVYIVYDDGKTVPFDPALLGME